VSFCSLPVKKFKDFLTFALSQYRTVFSLHENDVTG